MHDGESVSVARERVVPVQDGDALASHAGTLQMAVAGALVSAVVHVAIVEVRFRLMHRFTWTSREFPWYSPLAYLFCFLLFALPMGLGGWLAPRLITLRVRASLLAAMAVFAILLHLQGIYPWAGVMLALGVGTQVGAMVAHRPLLWLPRARRLSIALAALLAIYGLPFIAGPRIAEARRATQPLVDIKEKPNVILLILDTVRAANLSLYGYARATTPNLTRLAAQGVTFERAIAPSPWTAPTHATLATGKYPSRTGVSYFTPMDDSLATVAQAFADAGYATGAFMANAGFAGRQTGLDRGFGHFEDYPASLQQLLWSATFTQTELGRQLMDAVLERGWWKLRSALGRFDLRIVGERRGDVYNAGEIANNFMQWRDQRADRPYFAMLNMLDAHAPYRSPLQRRFREGRGEMDRYDGAIAFEDSVIGDLVARLAQRGDLEKTILVVLADHGEQFGEHGLTGHGNSLYLPLLRVPLLIHAPSRAPAGLRDGRLVSLRDVPATMLDLAGVRASRIGGVSLARGWRVSPVTTDTISPAIAEVEENRQQPAYYRNPDGPVKSILDSSWHYIFNGDGTEEVYRWDIDPDEQENLRGSAQGRQILADGRGRMAKLLGVTWPPSTGRSAGR